MLLFSSIQLSNAVFLLFQYITHQVEKRVSYKTHELVTFAGIHRSACTCPVVVFVVVVVPHYYYSYDERFSCSTLIAFKQRTL
ncbi:hypothetical protein BDB00DRAFT_811409 [Zychaea mexicana]|uniref:uncharacterized protein n=1 Tax=Zychaea mexicana TaxID=64656 RepID=UPI0022FDCE76|nr:uncharacterized protein BDB00DRAFT_811409 [Zychaea mexicana]KAI9496016.1 hypothetical protein BDB00DRAFT_811409 [Zychaea mexicana]